MSKTPPSPPTLDALSRIVARHTDARLVTTPWQCNVINLHSELIGIHNARAISSGKEVEVKFANPSQDAVLLSDLLKADYSYLCEGAQILRDARDHFVFAEVSGPYPNTECLKMDAGGVPLMVICFRGQLLQFIQSAYSKIWVLCSDFRHAGCLEEHDPILEGDDYSDTNLLAGLFNDIEILFDQKKLFLPFQPRHMACPYDYCERVEGTRRFLLAHEAAHALYKPDEAAEQALTKEFGPEIGPKWAEEIWCDSFAVHTFLNRFSDRDLEGPNLYELEGVLVGIMTFFTLMEIVEIPLRNRGILTNLHPPHRYRLHMFRDMVREHPVFSKSDQLRATLKRLWQRLHSFRGFAGGATAPLALTKVWNMIEFREKLSDFGREAYRACFDDTVNEWRFMHDGNSDTMNGYQECF